MSASPPSSSSSPSTSSSRHITAMTQLTMLFQTQLAILLRARKTIALLVVQLIPALAALFYIVFNDIDGLTLFRNIVEHVSFPFLIPLTALFFGGPTIVDEMEGRTLTYLTLRPIQKPIIYLGKLLAAWVVGTLVVVIPTLVLAIVCVASSDDMAGLLMSMGQILGAASLGVICYTSIFALLGALFTTSLISSVVYFVIFEIVFAVLPILELLSVRYYLRTVAEFNVADRLGMLDKLVLDKPIVFPIWAAILILLTLSLGTTLVGSYVFKERQYVV